MDFRVKVTAKITLKNIQLGVANKDSAGSLKELVNFFNYKYVKWRTIFKNKEKSFLKDF